MSLAIPILLYHSMTRPGEATSRWSVPVDRFEQHLAAIGAVGRQAVTVSALVDGLDGRAELPASPVAITFDDAYEDFAALALPRLEAAGMPATLYACAGLVGGRLEGRPTMGWAELRDAARRGTEVGSHGWSHAQLDLLPDAALEQEARRSREHLQRGLGAPVRSLAYPHGYHDARVVQAARSAGYESAVAVKNALSHAADDRFAMARVTMGPTIGADDVTAMCAGGRFALVRGGERTRTRWWRTARRVSVSVHAAAHSAARGRSR